VTNVVGELPVDDLAFHVEQRGIDFIPESERWATPRAVAGLWAGANLNIEYLVYGAILATFGFSFVQCVILIVVGNLSWVLVGFTSLQGPQAGTTTMTINRAPFGPRGSKGISLFNWLTQLGFEIEGLILIVGAGIVLAHQGGVHVTTGFKVILILAAVAVQVILPFLGHATMAKVLRWLILPFIVIYVVLACFAASHASVSAPAQPFVNWQLWTEGLAFTITLSGLGWTENGNDYSRYLPANTKARSIIGWLFLGTALPEIALMTLGAATLTFIGTGQGFGSSWNAANPFSAFLHQHALPGWLVAVFMCFIVVQLFGINSLDLYSSGVTLQAMGVKLRRYHAVLLDSVICLGFTFYAVFDARFSTLLKDFVDIVIVWIAPWCGIYLVDWLLRRRQCNAMALQQTGPTSRYWGNGGVNWAAVIAQVLGGLAALQVLAPTFTIPSWLHAVSVHNAGAGTLPDFSVFAGFGVGALVYWALGRVIVNRQEGALRLSG
jgi:nucleobase:cation symporter-1, NCS1 family